MTMASGLQGGFPPPRLEANCTRHGAPLVMCDHCSNIGLMAQWAGSLSGDELAAGLEKLAANWYWYAPSERLAILAEAARRVRAHPASRKTGHRAHPVTDRPLTDAEISETCPVCNEPPGKPCKHATAYKHLAPLARPHAERIALHRNNRER